ncbi:hypothetical protein CBS147332_5963 [Penicillium roqueforti]|nr:hypothetical protein CBS147332_5963 [Penicillium roqueforti]KAI3114418.1 hypothetical protein CBS147331_4230 [Penicillium roqueforti]
MGTTPLASLPRDCWLKILEYLPNQDSNNLSKVSHDTRASTEPFLYRSIHWDWQHPPIDKILLLLRTISERPELASYIWHVSLVWWDVESQRTEVTVPEGRAEWNKMMLEYRHTLIWARKLVRDANFPANRDIRWLGRLFDGDAYAYATVLILQLHNLRSLRLDFSFVLEEGFPGEMLHHSLFGDAPPGMLSQFSKLEMVDYGSNFPPTELRDNIKLPRSCQFIPWFYLPSLKVLEIWLLSVEGISVLPEKTPKIPLNLSKLRSLVISKTSLLPEEIASLLSQVPYLESLHVGMVYKCRATAEFLKAPECLLRSLETSSQTIEHLSISLELLPCCLQAFTLRVRNQAGKAFCGMLMKFPKLKTASLPLKFLIGCGTPSWELRDVLPSTLEAIHISHDLWPALGLTEFGMQTLKAFELLMRHKQDGSHPYLNTFSYQGMLQFDDELNAVGFLSRSNYIYLVKQEAMHLFCRRKRYNLFSRYSDCTHGFMLRGVILVDNVVYRLPWPFVGVDELPTSMPRHLRITAQSNGANV